jgi:hypothetical protein
MGQFSFGFIRREILITWCYIDHTHLKHGHLIHIELAPVCIPCDISLTVLHRSIMIECQFYAEKCHTFHFHGTLCNILRDSCCSLSNILAFVSGMGFAKCILLALPGIKHSKWKTDHSPLPSAKVNNVCSFTSTSPPFDVIVFRHRENYHHHSPTRTSWRSIPIYCHVYEWL